MFRNLVLVGGLAMAGTALGQHQMVSIGSRRLSIDCSGSAARSSTVVLSAGGGRTAKDWEKVRPAIAAFARVCSYDRAGYGESDKVDEEPQSANEIVSDMHALLKASGEKAPFVLVAHSIAGIYVRNYAAKFPGEAAAFVFVDSSHEEQAARMHEIDPQGPGLDDRTARMGFFVKPGERLEWRTELPLVVLAHGKPYAKIAPLTEDQWAAADRLWRGLQEDLAKRSPRGQLRVAERSGHFIQLDQPELVIRAVRDVIGTY